jgi:hypothetical protein
VWFGGQVVDGLAQVIDEHVAAEAREREPMPAALWLTHAGIAERLARAGTRSWPSRAPRPATAVPCRSRRSKRATNRGCLACVIAPRWSMGSR